MKNLKKSQYLSDKRTEWLLKIISKKKDIIIFGNKMFVLALFLFAFFRYINKINLKTQDNNLEILLAAQTNTLNQNKKENYSDKNIESKFLEVKE